MESTDLHFWLSRIYESDATPGLPESAPAADCAGAGHAGGRTGRREQAHGSERGLAESWTAVSIISMICSRKAGHDDLACPYCGIHLGLRQRSGRSPS